MNTSQQQHPERIGVDLNRVDVTDFGNRRPSHGLNGHRRSSTDAGGSSSLAHTRDLSLTSEAALMSASFGAKVAGGPLPPCDDGSMSAGSSAQVSSTPSKTERVANPLAAPSLYRDQSTPSGRGSQVRSRCTSGFTVREDLHDNKRPDGELSGQQSERSDLDDSGSHLPRFLPGAGIKHSAQLSKPKPERSALSTTGGGKPPVGIDTLPMHSTAHATGVASLRHSVAVGRTNNTVHAGNMELEGVGDDMVEFPAVVGRSVSPQLISPSMSEGLFNSFISGKRAGGLAGGTLNQYHSESSTMHSPSTNTNNNPDTFYKSTDSSAVRYPNGNSRARHNARVRRWYASSGLYPNASHVEDYSDTEMLEDIGNNVPSNNSSIAGGGGGRRVQASAVKRVWGDDEEISPAVDRTTTSIKCRPPTGSVARSLTDSDGGSSAAPINQNHLGRKSSLDGHSCHDALFSCFPCCYMKETQNGCRTPRRNKRAKRARNAFCGGCCCKIFTQLAFLIPMISIGVITVATIASLTVTSMMLADSIDTIINHQRDVILGNQVLSLDAPVGICERALGALQYSIFSGGFGSTMEVPLGDTTFNETAYDDHFITGSSLSFDPTSGASYNATQFAASRAWILESVTPSMMSHIRATNFFVSVMSVGLEDGTYMDVRMMPGAPITAAPNTSLCQGTSSSLMGTLAVFPTTLKNSYNQMLVVSSRDDGAVISTNFSNTTYDPRGRFWYKTVKNGNPVFPASLAAHSWSTMFLFGTNPPSVLFDFSGPLFNSQGAMIGVAALSVELHQINNIVNSMTYLDQTVVLLDNETSLNVLATNRAGDLLEVRNSSYFDERARSCVSLNTTNTACHIKLQDIDNNDIRKLVKVIGPLQSAMSRLPSGSYSGRPDNDRFAFVDFVPGLTVGIARTQPGWILLTAISTYSLMEDQVVGRNIAIVIVCFCLVVAVVLIALLLGCVVLAPLRHVAARIIPVATLTDDALERMPDSMIFEVSQITQSFNLLADELAGARAFLPPALFPGGYESKSVRDVLLEAGLDAETSLEEASVDSVLTTKNGATSVLSINNTASVHGLPDLAVDGKHSDIPTTNSSLHRAPSSALDRSLSRTSLLLNTTTSLFNKKITVLFVNVIGYHKGIKHFTTDEFLRQASFLSASIDQASRKNKGVVTMFHGDRCLITFNASFSISNHSERAALAALNILSNLHKWPVDGIDRTSGSLSALATPDPLPLSSSQQLDGILKDVPSFPLSTSTTTTISSERSLAMTCGIASGDAVVGNLGCSELRRVGVVGPVVTRAVALERLCRMYGPETSILTHGSAGEAAARVSHVLYLDWAILPQPVAAPRSGFGSLHRPSSPLSPPIRSSESISRWSDLGNVGAQHTRKQSILASTPPAALPRRTALYSVIAYRASPTESWLAATSIPPAAAGDNAPEPPSVDGGHDSEAFDLDVIVGAVNKAFKKLFVYSDYKGAREVLQGEAFLRQFSIMHAKRASVLERTLGALAQSNHTRTTSSGASSPLQIPQHQSPVEVTRGRNQSPSASRPQSNPVTNHSIPPSPFTADSPKNASSPIVGISGAGSTFGSTFHNSSKDLLTALSSSERRALTMPSAKFVLCDKVAPSMRLLRSFLGPLPSDPLDSHVKSSSLPRGGSDLSGTPLGCHHRASSRPRLSVASRPSFGRPPTAGDATSPQDGLIIPFSKKPPLPTMKGPSTNVALEDESYFGGGGELSGEERPLAQVFPRPQTSNGGAGVGDGVSLHSSLVHDQSISGNSTSNKLANSVSQPDFARPTPPYLTSLSMQSLTARSNNNHANGNPQTYVADYSAFFELCVVSAPPPPAAVVPL